jgi:dUTPase
METQMVTQPAYLRNLKEYARRRTTDSKTETDELIADYSSESDRGAIILVATTIEDMLQDQITKNLPVLLTDETARKKMFEHDGLISSFSKKIEMAYAMGIIDEDYRKKIDLVREIRNACAHSRFPISMEKKVLQDVCKALFQTCWMISEITNQKPCGTPLWSNAPSSPIT